MTQIKIKHLKRGRLFRLKNDENSPLWIRSEYNRTYKSYEAYLIDTIDEKLAFCIFKADDLVWIK